MIKNYHIIIFGCQMNISDAERVASVLESAKYKPTEKLENADLIVVTMCSIRQSAVDRVHGLIEKFKVLRQKNPKLKTILTGCILKKDKKIFLEGFDYVVDIKNIAEIPELLSPSLRATAKQSRDLHANPGLPRRLLAPRNDKEENYLDITSKYISKFSATVPIMTGCNNFCSYCVVPYTREREISRSAKEIISEVRNLVKNEYKEIWLLGQNVNSYKDGLTKFADLLREVNKIPGDFWIRYTSSHPKDFNEDVIDAMAERGHITPYLNLPVQSGDNKVLKSMNRHYTVAQYKAKLAALRKKIPEIAISTDIIVGFAGETKKQFENTAKLFRDVKYDMVYINKYSPRAGTAAAKLKDNVSWEEKKRREKVLNDILKKTALAHNKKFLNKNTVVLVDSKGKEGIWLGKNPQYKTVVLKSTKDLMGQFVKAKITEVKDFVLTGEIINE